MKGMFRKEEIQSIKRLIHFDRINEEIKDMTFLPYANALVASGQTGIYLVDMGQYFRIFVKILNILFRTFTTESGSI